MDAGSGAPGASSMGGCPVVPAVDAAIASGGGAAPTTSAAAAAPATPTTAARFTAPCLRCVADGRCRLDVCSVIAYGPLRCFSEKFLQGSSSKFDKGVLWLTDVTNRSNFHA